jgi:parallel beta-helix repeat protein
VKQRALWALVVVGVFGDMPDWRLAAATWDVCPMGCAFTRVQDAVDAAAPGDRIRVGQGTYLENIVLDKGVVLEGGYSGPPEWYRVPLLYRTVLDGNGAASVVRILHQSPVLDGFVITRGRGTGAGVYIIGASATPMINGNVIVDNVAGDGGGIFVDDLSSPLITNNVILRNHATANGAGIYLDYRSRPVIINNVIADNSSGYGRQGIFTYNLPSATVRNNIIVGHYIGVHAQPGTILLDCNDVWNNVYNYVGLTPDECSLSVDPEFQEGTDSYHLRMGSPLIDQGSAEEAPAWDFDGDARPLGAKTDIGADESTFFRFTDDPLISQTTAIKAIHFMELRARITALRMRFRLPPFSWTDTALTAATVNAVHLEQLLEALVEASLAAIAAGVNVMPPSFDDDPLVPKETVIRRIHIEQLRAAVLVLEES